MSNYFNDELPVGADFTIPENHNFVLTADELEYKIGVATYEFAEANRKLRTLEVTKTIREKKLRIILLSRRIDLLTNEKLKVHLATMFEDPKFKWTGADLEAAIFVEQEAVMSEYARYEKLAKQAEKEYEMYNNQMISRHTRAKHDAAGIQTD